MSQPEASKAERWTVSRRGRVPTRLVLGVGVVLFALGMAYPWPWVCNADDSAQHDAKVRRLAGPEGCLCVGLTVDHLWGPEGTKVGHAEAFCMPEPDERLSAWLEAGTVPVEWMLTLRTPLFAETELASIRLKTVGKVDAAELFANNGCAKITP